MMRKVRIAVLDTCINLKSSIFRDIDIHIPYSILKEDKQDQITHGDMVCSLIIKEFRGIELTVFPIFSNEGYDCSIDTVLSVLNNIKRADFDIVNLSMGISYMDYYWEFKKICEEINSKGTIIVAAYDNNGMLSLPAVLDCVIGVDCDVSTIFGNDFIYEKNSCVNIRGSKSPKRINIDNRFTLASGSSFFAPYITGILAKWIYYNGFKFSKNDIENFLENEAVSVHINKESCDINYPKFNIKKAIVLPFNKEIHALARFSDWLSFEIVEFYDFKYFLKCGSTVKKLLNLNTGKDYIVKSVENIDWEKDFDTVILGHVKEIVNIIGKSFLIDLVQKCVLYHKALYSFDDLSNYVEEYDIKYFSPYIKNDMLPRGRFGKLWDIDKPVIGVFGTRTQQGKFTVQQMLRYELANLGYKCGYLATEPSGYLFDADEIFSFGYNSSVELNEQESILYINDIMHKIAMKSNDLIIVGSQSGTVPYDFGNMSRIVIKQTAFIYGTNPDAVVLCVCCDDDFQYIRRTIQYIESSCDCCVVALFVFPLIKEMYFTGQYKNVNILGTERYNQFKESLKEEVKISVYDQSLEGVKSCIEGLVEFFQ